MLCQSRFILDSHWFSPKFIRLLGGTLSLAIGSTIMWTWAPYNFLQANKDIVTRNNTLTTSMKSLDFSSSLISGIVDNPSHLRSPLEFGISSSEASYILEHGYTRGFRFVFILNAGLTTIATLASVVMIKHKELTRRDDELHREKALGQSG